jgi:hypothetical protein
MWAALGSVFQLPALKPIGNDRVAKGTRSSSDQQGSSGKYTGAHHGQNVDHRYAEGRESRATTSAPFEASSLQQCIQ